jgi:diaminopimelate epimerase
MIIQFTKMHGLGNDFVIIDARSKEINITKEEVKRICDRKFGVGCDQLIIITNNKGADAEIFVFNHDGSESGACGNATRCVAKLMNLQQGTLKVGDRYLKVESKGDNISVNMGIITFDPLQIPINSSHPLHLEFPDERVLRHGHAGGIGNPHLVFFIEDFSEVNVLKDGRRFEYHPIFPQRVNVSFAKVINDKLIELKVWERGVGPTLACGSAACVVGFLANKLPGG